MTAIRHALLFTVIFTAVIIPLVFGAGLVLAGLLQHSRPGVAIFRAAVIAPVTIGFATASYLWLSLIDSSTGIFDRFLLDIHVVGHSVNWLSTSGLALTVVVVLTVWKLAGFAMIVLINGLQGVPSDVEEAARIDGAKRLRILWSIKLPLMRRSIVLALVFVALAGFLSFDQFYILTGGAPNGSADRRRVPHLRHRLRAGQSRLCVGAFDGPAGPGADHHRAGTRLAAEEGEA